MKIPFHQKIISPITVYLEEDIIPSDGSNILVESDDPSTDHQVTQTCCQKFSRVVYAKRTKTTIVIMRRTPSPNEDMKLPHQWISKLDQFIKLKKEGHEIINTSKKLYKKFHTLKTKKNFITTSKSKHTLRKLLGKSMILLERLIIWILKVKICVPKIRDKPSWVNSESQINISMI